MNQRSRDYLRNSELKILKILSKHKKGLTWTELLKATGLSKSTLHEALKYLKKRKLITKAIREDDKPVYRAEITRKAYETLEMIEEFLNYKAFKDSIEKMNKDALYDNIIDTFALIGAALITELEIEAINSKDSEEFKRKLKKIHERITQASSNILKKILDQIAAQSQKAHNLLIKEY